MSIYLRDIQAYDPQEFGEDIQALIEEAIKEVPLKDIFDPESSFYDNLIQNIKDVLYEFCDSVADESYDQGYEMGDEAGYERGWESASDEMYSADHVEDLECDISNLRSEISQNEATIEELEEQLEEARQTSVEVDLDEIRQAVKADLLAEMTPDPDYED
jgi:predicted RNase H-like nuclease (RuvC/YqgF family)